MSPSTLNIMADSDSCEKVKENYDICFNAWYLDNTTEKYLARKNLSKCNQFLLEYKKCVNKTLHEDYAKMSPLQRKTAFYY